MRHSVIGVAAVLGVACVSGSRGTEDSRSIDAGQPVQAPCEMLGDAATLKLGEGGRLILKVAPSEAVINWQISDAGPFTVAKVDHTHLQLKAPYGQMGEHGVLATLDCGERGATHEWKVAVHALAWTQMPSWTSSVDGPPSREYGSFWVDSENPDRALLYGGFLYKPRQFTPGYDLWELNLSNGKWKALTQANEPPRMTGGRMALAPEGGQALYLGGFSAQMDTPYQLSRFSYSVDQLRWAEEPIASGTRQGDYQPGFFYDAKRERFISFCGANNTIGWHCNVRSYTPGQGGGRWEDIAVEGKAPAGRNGHFYAYDAETDRLVLFGGDSNGSTFGDTWALELGEIPPRWVPLGSDSSMRRRNGAFVLDAANHRFIMMGGTSNGSMVQPDVWFLDLDRGKEQWVRVTVPNGPQDRASGTAIYDGKRNRVLMGLGNSTQGIYTDMWSLQL